MTLRKITAKYASKCPECGLPINVGDLCWWAKGQKPVCVACHLKHGPSDEDEDQEPTGEEEQEMTPTDIRRLRTRADADGVHRREVGSVAEAVADLLADYAQTPTNLGTIRQNLERHLSGGDAWANFYTREKLLAELAQPKAELVEAVERMRSVLVGRIKSAEQPRRRVRRGLDWGDELDADRVMRRDPFAWERSVREQMPKRTVVIGCNSTVHWKQRPEELLWRGAAALALADVLQAEGHNVEIVMFLSLYRPTRTVAQAVSRFAIKDAMMPCDVGALAFAMCEIAFWRLVCVYGSARHWPGQLTKGLGRCMSLPEADGRGVDFLIENDVKNEEAAVAWLRNQLAREGVEV
jgi:hypothetical protein